MKRMTTLCCLIIAAACAAHRSRVPLVGPSADIRALVGHWLGEYGSPITGRSGTIDFTVAAHGDSASGVVMMIPAGWGKPLRPWRDPALGGDRGTTANPSLLTISLVRVSGGEVRGALAPYMDPETGNELRTTFQGRLSGDTISGTFATEPGERSGGATGQWKVVRQRP